MGTSARNRWRESVTLGVAAGFLISACKFETPRDKHESAEGGEGGTNAAESTTSTSGGANSNTVAQVSAPPLPISEHPICIVSADCPTGTHCDLGECVQACNTTQSCGSDSFCSARARCVSRKEDDVDVTPDGKFKGVLSARASANLLSELDTQLTVTLTSSKADVPVRYRVQVEGPHLSVAQPRGEFKGTTTVQVAVNGAQFAGQDLPGTIRIFSDLGEISVAANLHAGLKGLYRGALSYDDGAIALGDARVRIALDEVDGGVLAWIDPSESLLFPEDAKSGLSSATGSGTRSGSKLTLTIGQRLPKAFGGARNHLGRDIGRQLTMTMKPTKGGGWSGSFEETISGLFVQPVTRTGTVVLAYEGRDGVPQIALNRSLPSVTLSSADLNRAHPGWPNCTTHVLNYGSCNVDWATASSADRAKCLTSLYSSQVLPLYSSIKGNVPYASLAGDCSTSLSVTATAGVPSTAYTKTCGMVSAVECGVQLAAQADVSVSGIGQNLNKLVDGAVNPVLLVAQQQMLAALDSSVAGGATVGAELATYDKAATVLDRAANWLYQPVILESLRKLTPADAALMSLTTAGAPPYTNYPAARSISKLLRTIRDLEAERTRLYLVEHMTTELERRQMVQASALSSYLEGTALNVLLDAWGKDVPSTIGAESTRLLAAFDNSFGEALQGAGLFGVPDSFVPFVYDPKAGTKGKNNFEQMLNIAALQVSLYSNLETTYTEATRAARASDYVVASQALQLKTQYDERLKQLCGTNFDVAIAQSTKDISTCGESGGQLAVLRSQLESSELGILASQLQLKSMHDKIAIDLRLMADKYQLREENLKFIDDQGEAIDAIIWSQGIISAIESAISTASMGNVLNGFAPVGLALPMAILSMRRTSLDVARQDLQTAQQMHFEEQAAEGERLDAQANIEKQNIDLAQYAVHIRQALLDQATASIALSNGLAEAQMLLDERAQAETVGNLNPSIDPAFRIVRNDAALRMLGARSRAQKYLFLAGRALEYEINRPIADLVKAALVTRNATRMVALKGCLEAIPAGATSAQSYTRQVSVRAMLGITGPRKDTCTGELLTEAQQFQRVLLRNGNLDGKGGVGLKFATDLMPGNRLWSSDVCSDRITALRAQLVGDFLGDNEAQLNVSLAGSAILRDCSGDQLNTWSLGGDAVEGLGSATAIVQAGVNDFGKAAANTSLFGQSVARAEWQLIIPGASAAPTNADVDLTKLEDIVLEITHEATPMSGNNAIGGDLSCLETVL
ncbi:MAG: hypothetical protein QM784_40225 [Polyangiaceae bacterium]